MFMDRHTEIAISPPPKEQTRDKIGYKKKNTHYKKGKKRVLLLYLSKKYTIQIIQTIFNMCVSCCNILLQVWAVRDLHPSTGVSCHRLKPFYRCLLPQAFTHLQVWAATDLQHSTCVSYHRLTSFYRCELPQTCTLLESVIQVMTGAIKVILHCPIKWVWLRCHFLWTASNKQNKLAMKTPIWVFHLECN